MAQRTISKRERTILLLYFLILGLCGLAFVIADSLSPTSQDTLLPYAGDGFKITLGALLGALSAMLGSDR